MPDLVMHHYFGRKLLSTLSSEIQDKINDTKLYDFATAGPDPFFFVSFWNKKINGESLAFGNYMHRYRTRKFFNKLIEITKLDNKMFSYLCGFIAHYALDNKAHPYIFHKTGVYEAAKVETLKYRGLHTKLERAMDTYIIKKSYYYKPYKFKIYKHILTLKKIDKSYKESFDKLYEDVYDCTDGYNYVNKSIIDQRRFYKFIYDPCGIKQKLLTKLDNGKSNLDFKVLSYYNKEINDIDIFNLDKKIWVNPVDNSKQYHSSFFDLFDEGLEMAVSLITKLYKIIFLGENANDDLIPNLTYIDGLECELNKPMIYFNNIFD